MTLIVANIHSQRPGTHLTGMYPLLIELIIPSILPAYRMQGHGGLELIPALTGERNGTHCAVHQTIAAVKHQCEPLHYNVTKGALTRDYPSPSKD